MNKLRVVLGNQLFPTTFIDLDKKTIVFMCEDHGLCTYVKHHKSKIALFFCAMREYRDELLKENFNVIYKDCTDEFNKPYLSKLLNVIKEQNINVIECFEIEDKTFENDLINTCSENNLELKILDTPMFLDNRQSFTQFVANKSTLLHVNYYKKRRKDLNLLMKGAVPEGGKWTYDEDNRKKIPKDYKLPKDYVIKPSKHYKEVSLFIEKTFFNHPGSIDLIFPYNHKSAKEWFVFFLEHKFHDFGPFEDAIYEGNHFLLHSALSSSLNLGIITPKEIINLTLNFAAENDIPINSLEGFIRQIIGWREFIRGIYQNFSAQMESSNFWKHDKQMKQCWYDGTTGIPPLDDAISGANKFGYTHHINRLMILSNVMNLCRINPKEIYQWFMEMFIDSSDWVMVPNVYGMGTYADGGVFSTKPYICGSSYMLRMSNFKRGEWCDVIDGLYWKFIDDNKTFFLQNHRLSLMVNALNKIDKARKDDIFRKANKFINFVTK